MLLPKDIFQGYCVSCLCVQTFVCILAYMETHMCTHRHTHTHTHTLHTHTSLWIEPRGLLLRLSPKHLMRWPLTGETCTHKHTHLHTYALMCTWAHTQQPTKPPAANRLVHTPAKMCAIVQISKHYNWMWDETNCNGSYQKCFLMSYTWMSFVFK